MKKSRNHIYVMDLIVSRAEIVAGLERPADVMSLIETIGRASHASGESKDAASARRFVSMLIRLGHESVLEHCSVTVRVECDRAMAQQWTRHRLAAYTMESQRYVKYGGEDLRYVDPELSFGAARWTLSSLQQQQNDDPAVRDALIPMYESLIKFCRGSSEHYVALLQSGVAPEDARAILPNCTRTVFYTTANLRSWRHFFGERCCVGAQHNIRRVARELLGQFHSLLPEVFEDLHHKYCVDQ